MHHEDIVGERVGQLTIIGVSDTKVHGHTGILCKCDCGKTTIKGLNAIKGKHVKSCGCLKGKNRLKNRIGNTYGQLTVISRSSNFIKKGSLWVCKCSCGNTTEVTACALQVKNRRSCGKCLRGKGEVAGYNKHFSTYVKNARLKGLCFDITEDQFKHLIKQECYYCGAAPRQLGYKTFTPYHANGIDRVDSDVGYTIENCVPACSDCNIGKNKKSKSQFLAWIKRVHDYMSLGKITNNEYWTRSKV